jgi:cysteine synthase A
VGEVLKDRLKAVRICAVEPDSSPVISGGEPGYHKIQGLGAGFIPAVLNRQVIDEVIPVSDTDAINYTRRLASEEGLLVGISSGAACCAALRIAKTLGKGQIVVTVFADKGEHYLSTELFGENRWTQN